LGGVKLIQPKPLTLKKYGLTADEWRAIADRQYELCAVCATLPKSGRLCIDHEHVKGWKKLEPSERRKYVRGLVCYQCNHALLRRGMTPLRLTSAAEYLRAYAKRWLGLKSANNAERATQ
jgi:hypothetical protein